MLYLLLGIFLSFSLKLISIAEASNAVSKNETVFSVSKAESGTAGLVTARMGEDTGLNSVKGFALIFHFDNPACKDLNPSRTHTNDRIPNYKNSPIPPPKYVIEAIEQALRFSRYAPHNNSDSTYNSRQTGKENLDEDVTVLLLTNAAECHLRSLPRSTWESTEDLNRRVLIFDLAHLDNLPDMKTFVTLAKQTTFAHLYNRTESTTTAGLVNEGKQEREADSERLYVQQPSPCKY